MDRRLLAIAGVALFVPLLFVGRRMQAPGEPPPASDAPSNGPPDPSIRRVRTEVTPEAHEVAEPVDEVVAMARLADALGGFRVRCTLPPGMVVNAQVAEVVAPETNTVDLVVNRPEGSVDARGSDRSVALVSWSGATRGTAVPCTLSEPPPVEVRIRLVWQDDGSAVSDIALSRVHYGPEGGFDHEPVEVVDGVATFRARQFDTPSLASSFTGEHRGASVIYQDAGGALELLVGPPDADGIFTYTAAILRPGPDGLTAEMREVLAASVDTTSDMFPPAGFYDAAEIDRAVRVAREGAPPGVDDVLATHLSGP